MTSYTFRSTPFRYHMYYLNIAFLGDLSLTNHLLISSEFSFLLFIYLFIYSFLGGLSSAYAKRVNSVASRRVDLNASICPKPPPRFGRKGALGVSSKTPRFCRKGVLIFFFKDGEAELSVYRTFRLLELFVIIETVSHKTTTWNNV